jgi:hypothetical protein
MSNNGNEAEVMATSLVPVGESSGGPLVDLSDLGFVMPIATPERLRAAFADKQRLYAAILDESDYIYTVSFTENGRPKQSIYSRRSDAQKVADTYGVDFRASPKKSGVTKLASALGIESKRTLTQGLPSNPEAFYSYVVYEATHKRTGRSEEGVGWCDNKEKGGRISLHDIIATADTRAYNRAVLRLAGFGDVSADEIIAGGSADENTPVAPEVVAAKKPLALPAPASDEIVIAQRGWAEEAAKRKGGMIVEAQQSTLAAREMRARARRGNESVARSMGALGITWQGTAQDSASHETFEVEAPMITVADVERVKAAAEATKVLADAANGKPPGWDLSGSGNTHEENRKPDEKPVTRAQAAAEVPAPGVAKNIQSQGTGRDGNAETITNAQTKSLSEKLLAKFGTKEKAQAWLKKHADVERSALVRQNQYENLTALLAKEN